MTVVLLGIVCTLFFFTIRFTIRKRQEKPIENSTLQDTSILNEEPAYNERNDLPGTDSDNNKTSEKVEEKNENTGSTESTRRQTENELIKKGILINMELGEEYTLADMLVAFDCFPIGMTPYRLAALLSQLGEKGSEDIKRSERDNKAYFMLTKTGEQHRAEYRTDGTLDQIRKIIFETPRNSSSTGSNYHTSSLSQNPYSYRNTKSRSQKREYYTDWNGRKYYYDKKGLKKYKQERVYLTDWDGREYYIDKNGEKKYKRDSKKAVEKDPFEDAEHYNYYRNGITDHGTFVGTCKLCGTVWEFRSVEVIPVPYPHGTCPKCHQWVAVF